MWLIGSTPSKPAALTALNFSRTDPLKPMVAYMMAFWSLRFLAGGSAAAAARGASAAAAAAEAPSFRKLRRCKASVMAFSGWGQRDAVILPHRRAAATGA